MTFIQHHPVEQVLFTHTHTHTHTNTHKTNTHTKKKQQQQNKINKSASVAQLDAPSDWRPGPSCSKLTMLLVNDSLKFKRKYAEMFSAKNIKILYIESAKTVNEMTLNELVKLTTL